MCIFCKIANPETRPKNETVICENNIVTAFVDAFPVSKSHVLVVPKKHYDSMYDIDDETILREIGDCATKIARAMSLSDNKSVIITNNYGKYAGQVIDHAHVHVSSFDDLKPWEPKEVNYEDLQKTDKAIAEQLRQDVHVVPPLTFEQDCNLCDLIQRQQYVIYSDGVLQASLAHPKALNLGHARLSTRTHYEDLTKAPRGILGEMLIRSVQIGKAVEKAIPGLLGINTHLKLGSGNPHLSMDIIPRLEGDEHANWKHLPEDIQICAPEQVRESITKQFPVIEAYDAQTVADARKKIPSQDDYL